MTKNIPILKMPVDIVKRKEKILRVLGRKKMNIVCACKAAGITRTTYYAYLQDDEEFREKVSECIEARTDFVEDKLMNLIKQEVPAAVFFYLKCQAKSRGYIERREVRVDGELTHRHKIESSLSQLDDTQLTDISKIIEGECEEVKEVKKLVDREGEV